MYIKDANGNYVPTPTIRGEDGREVELRATSEYIQWRYEDLEWQNIVAIADLIGPKGDKGSDGKEVALRVVGRDIQWRLGNEGLWQSLLDVDLYSTIRIGKVTTAETTQNANVTNSGTLHEAVLDFILPRGKQGVSGVYVGPGEMPDGYNVQIDPTDDERLSVLPEGGTIGQVLVKNSNENFDVEWGDGVTTKILQDLQTQLDTKANKSFNTVIVLSADGWSTSSPHKQFISIDGFTGNRFENPYVIPEYSENNIEAEQLAWNLIDQIISVEGGLECTCLYETPKIDLTLIVKIVN